MHPQDFILPNFSGNFVLCMYLFCVIFQLCNRVGITFIHINEFEMSMKVLTTDEGQDLVNVK